MAKAPKKRERDIEHYAHPGKERVNNPPVGLVTPETDRDAGRRTWAHDPHIDPHLSWAGKAEHTSFEVPTVSLHVHERIDPRTVVEAVRKRTRAIWCSIPPAARVRPPTSPSNGAGGGPSATPCGWRWPSRGSGS